MKRISLALGIAVCMAASVAAQGPRTLLGWIDWTMAVGAPTELVLMQTAGWAFDCPTGDVPAGSTGLFFLDGAEQPAMFHAGFARPDVRQAFVGACPLVTDYTGFAVSFYAPHGTHVLDMVLSTRGGHLIFQQQVIHVP